MNQAIDGGNFHQTVSGRPGDHIPHSYLTQGLFESQHDISGPQDSLWNDGIGDTAAYGFTNPQRLNRFDAVVSDQQIDLDDLQRNALDSRSLQQIQSFDLNSILANQYEEPWNPWLRHSINLPVGYETCPNFNNRHLGGFQPQNVQIFGGSMPASIPHHHPFESLQTPFHDISNRDDLIPFSLGSNIEEETVFEDSQSFDGVGDGRSINGQCAQINSWHATTRVAMSTKPLYPTSMCQLPESTGQERIFSSNTPATREARLELDRNGRGHFPTGQTVRHEYSDSRVSSFNSTEGAPSFNNSPSRDDLPSSWPPFRESQGSCLIPESRARIGSDKATLTLVSGPSGVTMPNRQNLPITPAETTLAIRSRRRRSSTKKSSPSNAAETKLPPINNRGFLRKGGRVGKLPEYKAPIVAKKRQDRSVCIWCRLRRVTCFKPTNPSKSISCKWCNDHGEICIKANFTEISDHETMNCIFQKFCVYASQNQARRVYLRYSSMFDLPNLVETLAFYYRNYEVRVQSFTGMVWRLDLETCQRLLAQLSNTPRGRPLNLQEMINGKRGLVAAWVDCIRPTSQDLTIFERYYRYTNMPSRNSYKLLPTDDHGEGKELDVERATDRTAIGLIVQLTRVALRALEITALRDLQQRLTDMTRGGKTIDEIETLVRETALLLGSLRWRVAWWEKVETVHNTIEFTHRTTELAEILYFWYFAALKRLPDNVAKHLARKQTATYAEVGEIEEDLPTIESHDGFCVWMLKAHQIIYEYQVAGTLTAVNDQNATSYVL